jgi:hypothetical protein
MNHVIIGCDSETLNGPPITFQFYSKDKPNLDHIVFTSEKKSTDDFFDYLNTLPKTGETYILYGHNLSFDVISFFWSVKDRFLNEEVDFTYKGWKVSGIYANLVFLSLRKGKQTIWLLDTFAFFPTSLAKLADLFCPNLPKLRVPRGLGKKRFKASDKTFTRYASRDSEITYHVGKKIDEIHDELKISQSVSRANMAGKIFRHHYVKDPIPLPHSSIVHSALWAYHGGKNGLYCDRNKLYKNVYGLDIISAYPFAMSELPSFTRNDLYRKITVERNYDGPYPKFGIYKVWGKAKVCKYPVLFDHSFRPISGSFKGIWVSSFELNEAIRSKEVEIESAFGYFYDYEKDDAPSAWSEYAYGMFNKKNEAEKAGNKIYRELWKICSNSLYGKTIEMNQKGSLQEEGYNLIKGEIIDNKIFETGPLFNSFIASIITGHTRAYIHRLEHEYKALHTSTDGIFTQSIPKEKSGLGGLKIDFCGNVWIGRNKLYIGYVKDIEKAAKDKQGKPLRSIIYKDKFIGKYALHGFHASVTVLEKCILNNVWEYEYEKVNKLKESKRSGWVPNNFEKRKAEVRL